jgi:hypothetical protein
MNDTNETEQKAGLPSAAATGSAIRVSWVNGLGQTRWNYGTIWEQLGPNKFSIGGYGWQGTACREAMEFLQSPNRLLDESHEIQKP